MSTCQLCIQPFFLFLKLPILRINIFIIQLLPYQYYLLSNQHKQWKAKDCFKKLHCMYEFCWHFSFSKVFRSIAYFWFYFVFFIKKYIIRSHNKRFYNLLLIFENINSHFKELSIIWITKSMHNYNPPNKYSHKTRMGNWSEEWELEEVK